MKKMMHRAWALTGFIAFMLLSLQIVAGTLPGQATQPKASDPVKVFYFHSTRRCATCEAVEAVTREAIREYYGTRVSFESVNREEDAANPLIAKFKVSGQALLVVKGSNVFDLTGDAFMYARNKPDKLKKTLKAKIDSLL